MRWRYRVISNSGHASKSRGTAHSSSTATSGATTAIAQLSSHSRGDRRPSGSHTHYRSFRGRVFTGQMTQPTVSKHWRKILRIRLQSHHVHPTVLTMIQRLCSMKQKKHKYTQTQINLWFKNRRQPTVGCLTLIRAWSLYNTVVSAARHARDSVAAACYFVTRCSKMKISR